MLRTGWALWLLSLLTPDARGRLGIVWLAEAPLYGVNFLIHGVRAGGAGWTSLFLGAALLAGFAANVAVVLRLGVVGLVLSLALPWIPYGAYCALWYSGRTAAGPGTLWYFYPWVAGLGLIQASKLWRLREDQRRTLG